MTFHDKKGPAVSSGAEELLDTSNRDQNVIPTDLSGPLSDLVRAGYDLIRLHGPKELNAEGKSLGKVPFAGWREVAPLTAGAAGKRLASGKNVGVRLGETQVVIDWDPREDDAGDAFDRLVAEFGLDPYPRVVTGGGGFHLYLTVPKGMGIINKTGWRPGLDVKTVGGFVVAPGSVHPDTGRRYVFHADPLDDRVDRAAPSALIEALPKAVAAEGVVTVAGKHTPDELEAMLEHLDPADYANNDDWLKLAMSCHHATAGAGEDVFVAWSLGDGVYAHAEEENRRRWRSMRSAPGLRAVTEKTLYKALTEAGANAAIPKASTADDVAEVGLVYMGKNQEARDTLRNAIAAVHMTGIEPALDEFKQRIVFLGDVSWMTAHGRVFDDNSQRVLRHWLVQNHAAHAYEPSKDNVFEAVCTIATHRRFNPVLDYLDGLVWDGTPRVAALFSRYFSCEDDEYSRAVSSCFMVGAVRRQRQPGCKFDTVPVLRSGQGKGKSSGIKALFGEDWFSDAELGDLKGKDAAMALAGKWGIEMGELGSLKRSDNDTFKAFASRAVDSFRPPYGRTTIDVPRRCVFIGTVNEGGYISDETGARRLWPLEVTAEVDVAAIAGDRHQLWAEAATMEASGFSDVLPRHLWAVAAERQAAETAGDPWADDLRAFLGHRSSADYPEEMPSDKVHSAELFSHLGIQGQAKSPFVARRLRTVMEQSLGWTNRASVRIGDEVRAGYVKL